MIVALTVRGLGVLGEVEVELAPGLNVVTGETGAGKTLLVSSLALLCGSKPPATRDGRELVVEALVARPAWMGEQLRSIGLDLEPESSDADDFVLSRRVGVDGRTRARAGDSMVGVAALGDIGGALVEIHGQGAGFRLASQSVQLDALDAFGGCAGALDSYRAALTTLRRLERERVGLESADRERARETDVLSFQIEEIHRAQLDSLVDGRLGDDVSKLEHAERLQELGSLAVSRLAQDAGGGMVAEAARAIREATAMDLSAATLADRLTAAAAELADAVADVRTWIESCDTDPQRLADLRERAALVSSLCRKYGPEIEDVLAFAETASERLTELDRAEERAAHMAKDIAEAHQTLDECAAELTALRRDAARRLAESIGAELPALALPGARFEVRCGEARPDTERGRDDVEFLFSPNPQTAAAPLGRIASGGELSRVMIAITLALATAHRTPTLVFDEADQGVGGAAALDLGRRLKRLATDHQVLVVTHLPQIAAYAARHLVVTKNGSSVTVRAVEGSERVEEIARMLAGLTDSQRARSHAEELLALAEQEDGAPRRRQRRIPRPDRGSGGVAQRSRRSSSAVRSASCDPPA